MLIKIIKVLFFIVLLVSFNTESVYAAITVGCSSQGAYQSNGNCQHPDRASATSFADKFSDFIKAYADANVLFNYKNNSAWEQDMKPGSWSNNSIDDVEFMLFVGHGIQLWDPSYQVYRNSLHYYTMNSFTNFHTTASETVDSSNLTTMEAEWGKSGTKTRWVAAYSCNFLNTTAYNYNHMMQGINIMLGFGTTMYINSNEGMGFAMDLGLGANIIDSFLADAARNQAGTLDKDGQAKAIYAASARNDTLYSYAYASSKPNPIGGSTKYYSITRIIPAK